MASLRFKARIGIRNINPYVLVSAARARVVRAGWKKPMPVLVTINGQPNPPWRINMMPRGDGSFYLYLHGMVRKTSATTVGDRVEVGLWFDPTYRNGPLHPMPDWFRVPLKRTPEARRAWTALSPSRQKEILRYFSGLKSAEARDRNVQRALRVLSGSPGRFMGRSWTGGK